MAELLDKSKPIVPTVGDQFVHLERTASRLCPVHGYVRASEQLGGVPGVFGGHGDSDAYADMQSCNIERERFLDLTRQAFGENRRMVGIGVGEHYAELVSAEARKHVGAAHRS